MRHLIALSREIRCSNDIPQLVISFEEQTEESLIFSVILVRILKRRTAPLKQLLLNLPLKDISSREQDRGSHTQIPQRGLDFPRFSC